MTMITVLFLMFVLVWHLHFCAYITLLMFMYSELNVHSLDGVMRTSRLNVHPFHERADGPQK